VKPIQAVCLLLLPLAAAWAQPALPRSAPDFNVTEPSGRTTLLSSYRGDVVVLAFVVTTCQHCQALSVELEKMLDEFSPRGLRVVEIAFDENADVSGYVKKLGITFPVGKCGHDQMREFLRISGSGRIGTPQVIVIDRIGMIRAQSAPEGSPLLQSPDVLRSVIASLLKRGAIQ
jgi:peroxiredoxin